MWELMSTSTNHSWMLWTEDPLSQVLHGKSARIEIRGVVGTFSFSFNGVVQCSIDS